MAAENDLVLSLLREIHSELSSQRSRMEAIQGHMAAIERHIGEIKASVARAALEARIETLENS
jgi:hypothetical protein